jgi:hypothetical protein
MWHDQVVSSYVDALRRLREDLVRADYYVDPVMAAIGAAGQAGLARNHTIAASRALAGRDDPLATLIRLFVLQQPQPAAAVAAAVDWRSLAELGLVVADGDQWRASLDIRPFEDQTDAVSGWVVSDHTAALDTANPTPRPDQVLGVSSASIALAQITDRRPVDKALDLGTGCGVQSLHLARHCRQVVATDLNPRALTLASLTFGLNGVAVATRCGSLYEPVASDTFDLIATNPPFVIAPPTATPLLYRQGTQSSDDLMREVVAGAGPRLALGGSAHVVGNWLHLRGTAWQDRVASWVPPGCDGFVVQRELLDPYEYIEIWLADAGLAGRDEYRARYDQWLDYFDHLGVEAVGLGWVTLVKSGSAAPRVICEHWPYPVAQPVAADLMAHLAAMAYADWSQQQIVERRWRLAPGATQETLGAPGQADPAHVVLRRSDGLRRAIDVDAGLGGILGACDGELTLSQIIPAVAELLQVDPVGLAEQVMPGLRHLISQTWLTPVSSTSG